MAAQEREPVQVVAPAGKPPAPKKASGSYRERVGDDRADAEIEALEVEADGYRRKPDDWEPKAARLAAVAEQIKLRR